MGEYLKPCPFCGEKAESHNYILEGAVRCVGCPAAVVRQHSQFSEDDGLISAIAAWNRRTPAERGNGRDGE